MLMGYDEAEKCEILKNAITLSKPTMRDKISRELEMLSDPREINQIYQDNIYHLLKNTYLFKPKGNRKNLLKQILLQGLTSYVELWEGIGGEIVFKLTNFAYQFVRGRTEMVKILKEYVKEIIRVEYGGEVIIRDYKAYRHQKKIIISYNNIDL